MQEIKPSLIRVGILGAGRVTKRHADAMSRMAGIQLAAIADPAPDAALRLAEPYGARALSDGREILEDPAIDVVYICTPHHLHHPQAMAALCNGKHVFIEKPMANTVEECRAINREARERGLLVAVGHQQRYLPHNRRLRELLYDGVIGELRMITDHLVVNNEWERRAPWWKSKATAGGGMMMNLGVHQIDRCLWLAPAPPRSLYARVRCGLPELDVDTDYSLLLEMEDGVTLNLIGTSYPCKAEFRLDVIGTRGRLSVDLIGETLQWSAAGESRVEHLPSSEAVIEEMTTHFLEGVRNGTAPGVDGVWGEGVIACAHLAYRSAEEGTVLPVGGEIAAPVSALHREPLSVQ